MSNDTTHELLVERDGAALRLRSPAVGFFTEALPRGRVLTPGEPAGVLLVLGRALKLVVPADIAGVIVSERPERVHEPVGYGQVLYELGALESAVASGVHEDAAASQAASGLVLRSPQSGRFYRRPSPDAEPFAAEGAELGEGDPVGMIEVMKTFASVPYRAAGGLPPRARVVRWIAADTSDVAEGDPLLELEPA